MVIKINLNARFTTYINEATITKNNLARVELKILKQNEHLKIHHLPKGNKRYFLQNALNNI